MQEIDSKVKLPPVKIKLHWPDRFCSTCGQETEYLPLELYQCPSCHTVSMGRTEYIEGRMSRVLSRDSMGPIP